MSRVGLIWAQARDGVIGRDGVMPWHLPEDLAHFKEVTLSGPVVMGRRTWESIPERFRPLPGRRNIVITRSTEWADAGAEAVHSLDEALAAAASTLGTVWIIGGGQVYAEAIGLADVLEITDIDAALDGDTLAPVVDASWTEASASPWRTSRTGLRYRFRTLERS